MICEICKQLICPPGCPNHISPSVNHYCSICDKGVHNGEEYIVNDNGDYAHWECVNYGRDLAKFLGYEIKEMDDENYQ